MNHHLHRILRGGGAVLLLCLLVAASTAAATLRPDINPVLIPPDRTLPIITQAPATGWLIVETSPSGAEVTVDGVSEGRSPLTVPGLAPGSHTVTVSLSGYADAEDEVSIPSGGRVPVRYTLVPVTTAAARTTMPTVTGTPTAMATPISIRTLTIPAGTTPPAIAATTATVTATPSALARASPGPTSREPTVAPSSTPAPMLAATAPTTAPPASTVDRTTLSATATSARPSPSPTTAPAATVRSTAPPPFSAGLADLPPWSNHTIRVGEIVKSPRITSRSPYAVVGFNAMNVPMAVVEVEQWMKVDAPSTWGDWKVIEVARNASTYPQDFRWATELPNATGGVYQVSRVPFPAGGANWTSPPGLVGSGTVARNGDTWETFTIDMARAANRPASAGPLGLDAASKAWTFPVGFGWLEVSYDEVELGPVSFPFPNGVAFGKEEGDLPGAGAECTSCLLGSASASTVTDLLLSINQTFYVRVVPVDAEGRSAGNPSLPVEVTVVRPDGATGVGFTTTAVTHVLRPPSVRIVSYDPIRETAEPYHFYVLKGSALWPKGGHFYDPPDESTCDSPYVTDGDCWIQAADAISDAIEMVTGALATTWQMLQDFVVDVSIRTTILGPLGCDESDACRGFLKTTLQVVMVAFGVPPTLPSYAELKDSGAEYMAELALQEIGAGEAWDALPEELQAKIKAEGKAAANDLISSSNGEIDDRIGAEFIPDPEFLPHPGLVMLRVSNPNTERTDPCVVSVGDSLGFYRAGSAVLPSLAPGQSFAVPVSLEENIDAFAAPQICPVEVSAAGYCRDCSGEKGVWQSDYGDMYRFCCRTNWKTSLVRASEDRIAVSITYPDRKVSLGSGGPILPPAQAYQTVSVTYPTGWQVAIAPPLAVDPDQQSASPYSVFNGGFRNLGA